MHFNGHEKNKILPSNFFFLLSLLSYELNLHFFYLLLFTGLIWIQEMNSFIPMIQILNPEWLSFFLNHFIYLAQNETIPSQKENLQKFRKMNFRWTKNWKPWFTMKEIRTTALFETKLIIWVELNSKKMCGNYRDPFLLPPQSKMKIVHTKKWKTALINHDYLCFLETFPLASDWCCCESMCLCVFGEVTWNSHFPTSKLTNNKKMKKNSQMMMMMKKVQMMM